MASLRFYLLLFISLLYIPHPTISSPSYSSSSDLFNSWCATHRKSYSSNEERESRLKIFEDNLAFISHHNSNALDGSSTYTVALNAFADLTHDEFRASKLGLFPRGRISPSSTDRSMAEVEEKSGRFHEEERLNWFGEVPDSIDWRKHGAVTKVKDQGSCGACWSFSATGAIEGINKIVSGSLISLSEQELIDCDTTYNSGCDGGLMDYAFKFVIDNHGIDTEEDYPYEGTQKSCKKEKAKRHVVSIDGYKDVRPEDEKELLRAVATQPVSVGICGSEREFQFYSKGIFTGPCSTALDHAVLIVGYGSESGLDYWIVKNSWGPNWGMNGYIYMARNSGSSKGICGVNLLASYPVKTAPNPPPPPPPPSPSPSYKCNLFASCSYGETCCCTREVLGFCWKWRCCPLDSAVCCKDRIHCCPSDYPICDTQGGMCLKQSGNFTAVKRLEDKVRQGNQVVGPGFGIPCLRYWIGESW